MDKEEWIEIQKAIFTLNKFRNLWSHSDWKHEKLSNKINEFLPNFSNEIDTLVGTGEMEDKK